MKARWYICLCFFYRKQSLSFVTDRHIDAHARKHILMSQSVRYIRSSLYFSIRSVHFKCTRRVKMLEHETSVVNARTVTGRNAIKCVLLAQMINFVTMILFFFQRRHLSPLHGPRERRSLSR